MFVHSRKILFRLVVAAAAVGFWPVSHAAPTDYPNRPVRLVVPYPPGGGSDMLARIVAHRLDSELGQSVIVENRPGASTTIAAAMVARAPADGYTILLGTSNTFVSNAFFYPAQSYDPAKDFAVLGMPARLPFVLVASNESGIKSVAQLVARAKAEPGKLTYGSPGQGTPHHLFMELFKQQAGIDINHIPFKGAAPVLQDLLPGRIDAMFLDYAGGAALLKDGTKLSVLGTADTERSTLMPNVPSIAEAGFKSFSVYGWQGLAVRADTPPAIIAKLRGAVEAAVNDPKVQAQLKEAGFEPTPLSAVAFAEFINQERAKITALVKSRGLANRP